MLKTSIKVAKDLTASKLAQECFVRGEGWGEDTKVGGAWNLVSNPRQLQL